MLPIRKHLADFCNSLRMVAVPMLSVLAIAGCQGTRDKIKNRLYPTAGDDGWSGDSAFIASAPSVLYRVLHRGGQQYVFPIATIGARSGPLALSQRGWKALDSAQLWSTKSISELDGATVGPKVTMQRGMWENPTYPLDTVPDACNRRLPIGQVTLSADAELAVTNYKPQAVMASLDAGALQQAIDQVPMLVTPPLGVSAAMLSHYHRTLHQIPRAGSTPSILLEYNDPDPVLDTGNSRGKRPRNLVLVMEKGVYGYRPSWVYSSTRMKGDSPALHFIGAVDLNGDGWAEMFFRPDIEKFTEITLAYRHWNDSWRESWRSYPQRCVM